MNIKRQDKIWFLFHFMTHKVCDQKKWICQTELLTPDPESLLDFVTSNITTIKDSGYFEVEKYLRNNSKIMSTIMNNTSTLKVFFFPVSQVWICD